MINQGKTKKYTDKYIQRAYWVNKRDDLLVGKLVSELMLNGEREKTDKSELIREAMKDLLKKYESRLK